MNTKANSRMRLDPGAVMGFLAASVVLALGLLGKVLILEAGGTLAVAVGVALAANLAGAAIMEVVARTRGLVLLGAGLVIGATLVPTLWVADVEAWLRENPINTFIVILAAAWSTQGRPRWPILAVAGILAAAQILVAFI